MAKSDDIVEKIHAIETTQAVDHAVQVVNKSWWRLTHTVCITATSSIGGFFIWLGGYIYDNFTAVEIGVRAFIVALRSVK